MHRSFGLWRWHGICCALFDGDCSLLWCAFDLLLRHIGCRTNEATARCATKAPE
jgi:hypothetical protein